MQRQFLWVVLSVFLLFHGYLLLQKTDHGHRIQWHFPTVEPFRLWELFSNLEGLKSINPTLISYQNLSDLHKIGVDRYTFSVKYTEVLVNFAAISHEANASYNLYLENPLLGLPYQIHSFHSTLVLGATLKTSDKTAFLRYNNGTLMISEIFYECLTILSPICKSEFMGQRRLIHTNLQEYFYANPDPKSR